MSLLHYWLEFEESMGKAWDRYLNKKVHKFHEDARVDFEDISKHLHIFHRLMGGEKAKELQITDKRYIETSRTLLEKISFLGKEFFLTWQDEESVYLPASFAYFEKKEHNEMLYYWLVALAAQVKGVNDANVLEKNLAAVAYLTSRYRGFQTFYDAATKELANKYEQLAFLKEPHTHTSQELIENYPNPLWIYPPAITLKSANNTQESEEPTRKEDQDKSDELHMKKQSNQIDDKHETDGFLAFLPESLMSIFEQVNVDRCEDDSFDENALYHAEDLDEITIGQKQANLSSRVKMDLELLPDNTLVYPLGKGHFVDEWDYQKNDYLKNYARILPQVTLNVIPIELPLRLKKTVKKIQGELDMLQLDRIKNDRLPYGDELNMDSWIEYLSHQDKSMHHQNFYVTYEKKTRVMATLLLEDISLSTEG
jgi:nitric oxide reductase NorD protein